MNNLKSLRKSLKITQRQLADEIGHTVSSIGHYESGRRMPGISTCHQLSVAFGKFGRKVTVDEIFPHPDTNHP